MCNYVDEVSEYAAMEGLAATSHLVASKGRAARPTTATLMQQAAAAQQSIGGRAAQGRLSEREVMRRVEQDLASLIQQAGWAKAAMHRKDFNEYRIRMQQVDYLRRQIAYMT